MYFFSSIENFINSLKKFPVHSYYIPKKNALDELNFRYLIEDQKIKNSLEDLNYHCEDMSILGVFEADKLRKK